MAKGTIVKDLVKAGIKKTGKTDSEPNKLGGGGRFKQMEKKVGSPALAAWIGRKSLGAKKFNALAAKGVKGK